MAKQTSRLPARLEAWSVGRCYNDGYKAPEQLDHVHMEGSVYGSEEHREGEHITTSRVVETLGRVVLTASGSVYYLGEVSEDYREWCDAQGIKIDPDNPVKVLL